MSAAERIILPTKVRQYFAEIGRAAEPLAAVA
jgi:hypothetical protein